jgi:hypothetical protein
VRGSTPWASLRKAVATRARAAANVRFAERLGLPVSYLLRIIVISLVDIAIVFA